jgi:PmbA protein
MQGKQKALDVCEQALGFSTADQTQVSLTVSDLNLTRYANSYIHQNMAERDSKITVKCVIGKRTGTAETNSLEPDSIRAAVEKARHFAASSPENPDFVSLAKDSREYEELDTFDEETADCPPEYRAQAIAKIISAADRRETQVAGAFSTGYTEYATANSLGIRAYKASSSASLSAISTSRDGFGWADKVARKLSEIDPEATASESVERAVRSREPRDLAPGEYDVILQPYATIELMLFLAWLGFGAMAYQEGRSFMCGKLGKKITGDNISIWDDGYDLRGWASAFDAEGVPKQKVDLITDGLAKNVVYDSYTANKEGKESTGHSASGMWVYGPFPTNLFMAPGDSSVEEMIKSTKRGLLVTRFHYTNVVHELKTQFTGMTRDGTFWIENGEIAHPVKNLRFTESILEALSRAEAISRDVKLQSFAVVPAVKIAGFRFTGATEF